MANIELQGSACSCFDANETPENIFVDVQGMKLGDLWAPGLPDPPNGLWTLPHFADCTWRLTKSPWRLIFVAKNGTALLFILHIVFPIETSFDGTTVNCEAGFANTKLDPATQVWYDGIAQVSWKPDDGKAGLGTIMNAVVDENFTNWYAGFKPVDDDLFVARFYKKSDNSNIRIKYDQTI